MREFKMKPKQYAKLYFKQVQKNGANLNRKQKKQLKQVAQNLCKYANKSRYENSFPMFMPSQGFIGNGTTSYLKYYE